MPSERATTLKTKNEALKPDFFLNRLISIETLTKVEIEGIEKIKKIQMTKD
jgi:hypothetical protein